jgi:transcriptional regulator of acetoin/glycerol metabolism
MVETTEADDPESERQGSGRRALVMVFPAAVALPLPQHSQPVGRAWLEGVGIRDTKVSKQHVQFGTQGPSVSVVDLGSSNGTFVDGTRLATGDTCTLLDRAVLRIGHTVFVYRDDFVGPSEPDPPIGELVGPFGLRSIAMELARIQPMIGARPERILILGETGTGKELLARELSRRLRQGPYEPVNVTAVTRDLFDSALFGHARGAFSGAAKASDGIIKRNAGGTVFLDEIGDLPLESQPKLLRFLDSGEIQPLGKPPEVVNVLLVAATNRFDLLEQGDGLRSDLLARFTWRLTLSPLRERPEDIFAIANAFAIHLVPGGYLPESVDCRAVEQLLLWQWDRENSRELRRCILNSAARTAPPALPHRALSDALAALAPSKRPRPTTSLSGARAAKAVDDAGGNVSQAADHLGVSRGLLLRKLEK